MKNSLRFTVYSSIMFLIFGLTLAGKVYAQPPIPNITGDTTICTGESTTLTANETLPQLNVNYRWYQVVLGIPVLVYTGNPYTTPPLVINTTYEVEAFNTSDLSVSPRRKVNVIVSADANVDVPVGTPADAILCNGDSTTYTATSGVGNTIFHWYDSIAGGNLLFTGNPYNTGALSLAPDLYLSSENASGCKSPRVVALPVVVTPVLDVALVDPPAATACSGDSVTFTATSLIGGTFFTWYDTIAGGTPIATGNTFNTGPVSNTAANNLTATYYVEVSDANGCRSLRTPATVTVTPALDVPMINPFFSVICPGDSVSLLATSLMSAVTYSWYDSIAGGNLLYSGNPFNTGPISNAGASNLIRDYYVEVRDVNGCTSPRTSAAVIVQPSPDAAVVDPPVATACSGDSVTFTASSLAGNDTFTWYDAAEGGNQLATGNTFNTGPVNNSGSTTITTTYYVEVTDSNGCSSLRTPASVISPPSADVPTVNPPADTICSGGSAEFAASSLTPDATFNWYDNVSSDTPIFTGDTFNTGPIVNGGTANSTRTYYVEAADSMGCRSVRTPATVVILPALDAPISNPPADTICSGGQATFVGTSLVGSPTFKWYDDQTATTPVFTGDTFTTPVSENPNAGNTTVVYWLEASDANGCKSVRTPATVVILPAPDVPIVDPVADTICSGDSAEFTASTLLGTGKTFNWYDDETGGTLLFTGNPFNTGPINNTGTFNFAVTYYVEAVDSAGCRSVRTPATVVILPAVDAVLVDPLLTTICSGESVTFTASTALGTEDHFEWYDNNPGGNLLFAGNPFNTGPITNNSTADRTLFYYVEAVTAEGCRSSRTPATVIIRAATDVPLVDPPVDTICAGASGEFVATSLFGSSETFNWYDAANGGNLLFTGDTFNTGPIQNNSQVDLTRFYYVEAVDTAGCKSVRTPASLVIKPALDIPLVDPLVDTICSGGSAEFTASSILDSAVTFHWYEQISGGSPVFIGDIFNTGPLYNTSGSNFLHDYFVEAQDNAGCVTSRTPASVVIKPAVDVPVVEPAIDTICSGQSAEFNASSMLGSSLTFNWYDSLQANTPVFTGPTFNTGPLTSESQQDVTRTYFVEGVDSAGCTSIRIPVGVLITPALDFPLVTPPLATVCSGDSAEFVASSLLGTGVTYNWYDEISGGNLLFTGDTFTTPPVDNQSPTDVTTVYYVELENAQGCKSLRTSAVVITTPAVGLPIVDPVVDTICNGESAEFAATALIGSAEEFRWYDAVIEGNLLFVGDTFNTGPLTNTDNTSFTYTYYVEMIDTNGCSSSRTPATAVIRPSLDIPIVNPPIDTVCNGGSARFIATSALGSSTFNWYDEQGNFLFTGDTFTTEPLTNSSQLNTVRIFFVESVDSAGCTSVRIPVAAVIVPALDVVLVDPPVATICNGQSATFTASSLIDSTATYHWYTTFTGGEPIFTGDTFNTGTITNTDSVNLTRTYYAESESQGGCRSLRTPATVVITPALDLPIVMPIVDVVCNGQSAEFAASSLINPEATFFWYDTISGGAPIFVGDTFITEPLFNNTETSTARTFYVELEDSAGCRSARVPIAAVIRPALDVPIADPPIDTVCSGQSAMFTATSLIPGPKTFNWYTEIIGGTPVFTGDTFVTEPIQNSDSTELTRMYFVEVVDSTGCSSYRTPATVVIKPAADYPVVTPPAQTICSGDSATFVASSTLGTGVTYRWYDSPTGGNLLFVGDTFNTGPIFDTSTTENTQNYYVELEDAQGCRSFRATATVTVVVNPDIVLLNAEDPSICEGQSTSIAAVSVLQNDTIRWYLVPVGGVPVFVGDTFHTGPLYENTTFYAASVDSSSGCESARASIRITVGDTDPLEAPQVNCDEQPGENLVAFMWNAVPGANSYEVSTNDGLTWKMPSSGPQGLRHVETRQEPSQIGVTLVVRAIRNDTTCGPRVGKVSIGQFCPFSGEINPDDVKIFNSFSPNGDGANDTWYITDGIENYRNNEVMVFNRWGQKIFDVKGYDNVKNVFTGEGHDDGAYFYVVKIPEINVQKTGYVMIIR